jgi:hypothetical protein
MMGHRGFLQVEQRGQFTNASLLVGQEPQYLEPTFIPHHLEELQQDLKFLLFHFSVSLLHAALRKPISIGV